MEAPAVSDVDGSPGPGRGPLPGGPAPVDRIGAVDEAIQRLDGLSPAAQIPVYEQLSGLLTAALADAGPGGQAGPSTRSGN